MHGDLDLVVQTNGCAGSGSDDPPLGSAGPGAARDAVRLRLRRPLVWLDLETTGLSPQRDRIVEISTLKECPDGACERRTRRLNPGIPIPPEATEVHGITDSDVRDQPPFERIARSLCEFLDGSDLAGFGIARFDLPLLCAEFQRAGVAFQVDGRAVIDAQTIFRVKEPRDLSAAVRFYLARDLEGAHESTVDAEAARAVFLAQLERYPELPGDPEELATALRDPTWVDAEGKLLWRRSEIVVNFGAHRGKTLRELATSEPDYLEWVLKSDFSQEIVIHMREALGEPLASRTSM